MFQETMRGGCQPDAAQELHACLLQLARVREPGVLLLRGSRENWLWLQYQAGLPSASVGQGRGQHEWAEGQELCC